MDDRTRGRLDALATASIEQRLAILDDQQAAITRALAAANDGRWTAAESGADSVEGWLCALNPTWVGQLVGLSPMYTLNDHAPGPDEPEVDIDWIGSPNHSNGRGGMKVVALVIHTMSGSLAGCDAWFQNPAAQVSSHYGIGLAGEQHQYVRLENASWANGILQPGNDWVKIVGNAQNPNNQTVTVETEDRGSGATPVTDAQWGSTLAVCQVAMQRYPGIRYLMGHNTISPQSRPNCCGKRWWDTGRFQQLADALGLEAHF